MHTARYGVSSSQPITLNLAEVGLKVLRAAEPAEKAAITLGAWNTLYKQGELSGLPPLAHLSVEQQAELRAMPETALPGLPTNSLKSLLPEAADGWKSILCEQQRQIQDIPEHPARPAVPLLVGGSCKIAIDDSCVTTCMLSNTLQAKNSRSPKSS
jgi:hypothetical protein